MQHGYNSDSTVRVGTKALTSGDFDVSVTGKVSNVGSGNNWRWGIDFRLKTDETLDEYYGFRIWSEKQWSFYYLQDGYTRRAIAVDRPVLNMNAEGANTLRVIALGDQFTFFINGQKLAQLTDTSLPSDGDYRLELFSREITEKDVATQMKVTLTAFSALLVAAAP